MTRLLTISNEVLNASSKRMLGPELLAIVEKIKTDITDGLVATPYDLARIDECILRNTGLRVNTTVLSAPAVNAAMSVYAFYGHGGNTYYGKNAQPVKINGRAVDYKLNSVMIDLDRGVVSGDLVTRLTFNLFLNSGLFAGGRVELTPEEITGILLHEIGHGFDVFMAMGDYIYLNYMLSDGVEVLLGKKPNVYKLEVLNSTYLDNAIKDEKLREQIKTQPTEENLRRAILESYMKTPRHHLHSTSQKSSIKRDEQLADLFASRMGFGRALVTANAKMDKGNSGSYTRGNVAFAAAEIIKVLGFVLGTAVFTVNPLLSVPLIVLVSTLSNSESDRYDNPTERIVKIRKDLIAQFKQFENEPSMRDSINEDIKVIDGVLVKYNQNRTVYDLLVQTVFNGSRRQRQLQGQEETLEKLLNNDLFLHAHRISKLNSSEA